MAQPPNKLEPSYYYDDVIVGRFLGANDTPEGEVLYGKTFRATLGKDIVDSFFAKACSEAALKGITDPERISIMFFQLVLFTAVRHLAIKDNCRYTPVAIQCEVNPDVVEHPLYAELLQKNPDIFTPYLDEIGTIVFDPDAPTMFNRQKNN